MQGRPGDLKAGKVVEVTIFMLCMDTDLNSAPAPFKLSAEHFLENFGTESWKLSSGVCGNARPEESVPAEASFTGFRIFLADDSDRHGFPQRSRVPWTRCRRQFWRRPSMYLTVMCNASLLSGQLLVSQRHAIITPLLKKSFLDAAELKNYRPVSNLAFISKVTERIVSRMVSSGCRRITSPHYVELVSSNFARYAQSDVHCIGFQEDIGERVCC